MRAVRTLCLLLFAAGSLTLAACAGSTAGSEGADTFSVPIEVDNNLSGLGGASVYITRATGSGRRLLGPVESGQKRTFNYDARPGTYRLIARRGIGQDSIVSEQFQLNGEMLVQWALSPNRLLTSVRQ